MCSMVIHLEMHVNESESNQNVWHLPSLLHGCLSISFVVHLEYFVLMEIRLSTIWIWYFSMRAFVVI